MASILFGYGPVRDKVISWQFGAGGESDMYFAAFVVLDIINYLLAGGLPSITIPVHTRRLSEDEDDAWASSPASLLSPG